MVEEADRPAGKDRLGEREIRHVGPAPGAVKREKAQPDAGQPVEPRVALGDELAGALGRGVERDRLVGAVLDARRLARAVAVDRGRAGVDEALEARQPARRLEQHDLAFDIGVDIGERIGERVAHPGLRREMDDAVDVAVSIDERRHRREIGDIDGVELEAGAGLQEREARLFQRDIVIGVEIVDADHLLAAVEQPQRDVKPDKPRAAGNQPCHRDRPNPACPAYSSMRALGRGDRGRSGR